MNVLYNKNCNKVLKKLIYIDNIPRITISFYKYCCITNTISFRNNMYLFLNNLKVFGRIYIATEGINAQLSIPITLYFKIITYIKKCLLDLNNVDINHALDNKKSFWVLRIKVKEKILSDGISVNFFDSKNVGIYLQAHEVNMMLNDKDSILVDMRNHYEYKIGHFDNSINIPVNTFREQLKKIVSFLKNFKDKKIIMYCTGGIRCEKSTAWIKYHGFKYVYQIKGGIIKYVNDCKKYKLPIKFKGKNFVFDERMSELVTNDILSKCSYCNSLCDYYVNCTNKKCHFLFIQCQQCNKKFHGYCSKKCMNDKSK